MTGTDFDGPHFTPDLILPNGKLARLHKGGGAPAPPPAEPVARQPLDDAGRAADSERRKARDRRGYSKSVLADFAGDEDGEKKTVLG